MLTRMRAMELTSAFVDAVREGLATLPLTRTQGPRACATHLLTQLLQMWRLDHSFLIALTSLVLMMTLSQEAKELLELQGLPSFPAELLFPTRISVTVQTKNAVSKIHNINQTRGLGKTLRDSEDHGQLKGCV
ncbi:uncharacterized protein LOC121821382 isoform X2 [Peromyscus maniculatus bairdii]|uniref:uncharacterized protein LOC121821382 isoform X2 n=1 Tax=Peromyscus maniculatus bairdii TaxID=230844 RepID=UPI003FD17869